jgi:anti-anti-sigma factor
MAVAFSANIETQFQEGLGVWENEEISAKNCDNFLRWATDGLAEGISLFIIDLGSVEYVNAAGLASMLRVSRLASLRGIRIIWRNVNENIANLVRLAGLSKVIEVE